MPLLALALLLAQTSEPAPAQEEPVAEPPATEPVVEQPAPAPVPNPWTAGLSAGFTWIGGNVVSLTAVGGAQAVRKTDRTIWGTKISAGYGEKYTPEPHEVLLLNGALSSQFDYRFNPTISIFAGAGIDFDHVKSIEL